MSLMSLLIALLAERYLSSTAWQFSTYYHKFVGFFINKEEAEKATALPTLLAILILPVVGCYLLLEVIDDGLLYFIISTLILIVCFGCVSTRDRYKSYLVAAFRGEDTTCSLHHAQLQQDKNLSEMTFGQILVWLNYRYFIAILLFFVIFGAPGALFYRLLSTINEKSQKGLVVEHSDAVQFQNIQFWVDWLPVRIVAFGYMLVGHFSKAAPVWIEYFFEINKQPHHLLIGVAEKSEDMMVDEDDCTAEPCLLVKLAKRTLLLFLALMAVLILTGVIS